MTAIPGVTIDWAARPRIIIIPLAVRDVAAQDLIDTLREQECTYEGIDQERLLYEGTGKTTLDDEGTKVAITLVLLNAQLYFVPDTTARETGAVTTGDTLGKTLTDTTATFITNLVERGDTVYNATTSAISSVVEVLSETALTMRPLSGGTPNNQWTIGNVYGIWNNQQCSISGGNVVAIDDEILQNFISPVLESPNVQIVRTSSASATLQELAAIQVASFEGGVWLSATGGTGSVYPMGTPGSPVNNLTDALTIAVDRGFDNLKFHGSFTFPPGSYISGYTLWGEGKTGGLLTFDNSITAYCKVKDARVTGTTLGMTALSDCYIFDYGGSGAVPSSQTVVVERCIVEGIISLPSNYTGHVYALDCWGVSHDPVQFDMNGGNFEIEIHGVAGNVEIINCSNAGARVVFGMNSGTALLGPTVTAGSFTYTGVGALIDTRGGGSATVDTTGLVSSQQYASFQGGVTFNQATGQAGTDFPLGTTQFPVNNLADALVIGASRGLTRLLITGTASFVGGDIITGWELVGVNVTKHHCHTFGGGTLTDCSLVNLHVSGPLYGQTTLQNCRLGSVSSLSGVLEGCTFEAGTTTLSATAVVEINNCNAGTSTTCPSLNCGGTGQFVIRNFNGGISIKNKTGGAGLSIDLNSGFVVIDATCTGGSLEVRGMGALTNSSGGMAVAAEGLNQAEHNNLLYAIEAMRPTHMGYGLTFYVDPISGNNTYDGRSDRTAVSTVAAALALCQSGRGDVIYLVAPGTGTITITENVVITKEDIRLRGGGRGTTIQPASGVAITVSANNVSLSGIVVRAPAGSTTDHCVVVNNKNCRMEKLYVVGTQLGTGCGVVFTGGDYHELHLVEVEMCGGDGILYRDDATAQGSPREASIFGGNIYLNNGHGVNLTAIAGTSTRLNRFNGCSINDNGGYGIVIGANVDDTFIASTVSLYRNVSGSVQDLGINTQYEVSDPWQASTTASEEAGTMGARMKTIADDAAFIKYIEGGRWKIDASLNQMIFFKDDNITEVARFNLKDSAGSAASTDVFERVRA